MIIHVNQVERHPLHLEGEEPAGVLNLREEFLRLDHPLRYRLDAESITGGILVRGALATTVTAACDRCLQTFEFEVEVEDFVYLHEDLSVSSFDLTPLMREDILLLLPQRAVCSSACRGLCPHCGQNLNDGPCGCEVQSNDLRWGALDDLSIDPGEQE
ncbi:MAG: DUF177 domain-containing protein [Verrucomicrobiota bacterium]|jgi:uncharacterized protein|nr:DUF177 domain-containing protein [Verrucomicrobiota bacterium]MDD8044946.1 DUF177 domain-containing protein [Verrucomicrobiota bacterium]MDD8049930.1 DUF177 domain-containing protein [Verrucomicrobiota bacterium]MDI9383924.1 DUF177 domain-containing protein [Verrucomicrobiota bacterium]